VVTAHAAQYPAAWPPVNTHEPCACVGARADIIGTLDGKRMVVEVKTGSVQPTHYWQLALQARLAEAEGGTILALKSDGTFRTPKPPAWACDREALWVEIQSAARVAHWRLRHDPKQAQLSGDGPHALRRADGVLVPLGKADIVRLGVSLGAPLHLTWSCYGENERACGECESCLLRMKGFREAGYQDPIPYRIRV
jgi:hypothetical protein